MNGESRSINLVPKKWPAMYTISPLNVGPPVNFEPALGDWVAPRLAAPDVSLGNLEDIVTTTDI